MRILIIFLFFLFTFIIKINAEEIKPSYILKISSLDINNENTIVYALQNDSILNEKDYKKIAQSYYLAYGLKLKNKLKLINVLENSSIDQRWKIFFDFKNQKFELSESHTELYELKKRIIRSASFALIEKTELHITKVKLLKDMNEFTKNMEFSKLESFVSNNQKANEFLNKKFADEINQITKIEENSKFMNDYTFLLRMNYKSKLDIYLSSVIRNLMTTDEGMSILIGVRNNQKESILKLRELLDRNLLDENEIVDTKLQLIVKEYIK